VVDPLAAVAEAKALSEAGEWAAAADAWRAIVADNPEHGTYWCWLAMAYGESGRHAEALPAYRAAVRLGVLDRPPVPTDAGELHYRIALCHAALGELTSAIDALRDALAAGLRNPDRLAGDERLAAIRDYPWFTDLTREWQPADAQPADAQPADAQPADAQPAGAQPAEPDAQVRAAGCAGGDGDGGADSMGAGPERDAGWRRDLALLHSEMRRRGPNYGAAQQRITELVAALDRDIPHLPDLQVVIGFWRLLRELRDGHARIRPERARPRWQDSMPLWFGQFAEGVFVTEVLPGHERLLGAQLQAIDDRPVEDVLAALDPVLTRDNEYWVAATGPLWLRRTRYLHALGVLDQPDSARLRVRTGDGEELEVTVAAQPVPEGALVHTPPPAEALRLPGAAGAAHLSRRAEHYWFTEYPDDGLVYFQFNVILDDPAQPWEEFLGRLFAAVDRPGVDRLVVDLRHNGGGNTFLAAMLLAGILRRERINRPRGLFVIVGRVTFSAAQNLATMLERYAEAVIVGEPTGSSPNFVGETVPFTLPYSGIEANLSDLVWQTSWPMDRRVAVVPDLPAPPTFADFAAGRDAAMARILALPR
jgi:tetratricopeptide (TPR) repeat protein